jgi:CRP-like cAMP-binding protein
MLSAGRVKAFQRNAAGKQALLGEMSEGAFFGEISVLTGRPRTATVVAATACELLELDRGTLQQIAATHPHVWDVLRSTRSAG